MNLERPGISAAFLAWAKVSVEENPEPHLLIPYFDIQGNLTTHWLPPGTNKWNMFQGLINTPATGSAADLNKWSMIELARVLPGDCHLVMSVHDELIIDCPIEKAEAVARLVKEVMETTFAKLFDDIIPGRADVSSGPNWEAAKP